MIVVLLLAAFLVDVATGCGGFLSSETGTLTFPDSSSRSTSYPHGMNCVWVITTNSINVPNVTFTNFQLDDSVECTYEWLQVQDGSSKGDKLIARYCGESAPGGGNLIPTHNALYLWFHSDGNVRGEGFSLTWNSVQPASPHQGTAILNISTDQTVNIGERVQLDCTVNNQGNYPVLWLKTDRHSPENPLIISNSSSLLTHNARYSVITGTATSSYGLLIKDIQDTDDGYYQCQVVIGANERITRGVELKVRKPPVILNSLTGTLTLREGQPAKLECYARGYPRPQIYWRRENNIPLPSGSVIYRGNILQIDTIRKEDRGVYYCVADNGVGKPARRGVELNIEFAPILKVARPRIGQALQYDADMECTVDGSPDPGIYWIINGTVLQNDNKYRIAHFSMRAGHTSSVLRITKVQENDYGTYVCKASNKMGTSTATVEFFETEDPVCPPACNVRPMVNIPGQ